MPNLASQMRVAFSSMALNTGSSSPGELEMTLSTSEVAVCCSSDSVRSSVRWRTSSNSRTFSMAITAWSAKFVTSSICLSVNGSHLVRGQTTNDADRRRPLEQRNAEHRAVAADLAEPRTRYSGSARTSGIWTVLPSSAARPVTLPRSGVSGWFARTRSSSGDSHSWRRSRNASPSRSEDHAISASQSASPFDQRVEHRLQIEGRAADDLEHVGGRGLLLQRFADRCSLAQFEQPRVLDGDDGLGGEVLNQLDLLVGERADLLAVDGDRADELIVLEHRHAKAACPRHCDGSLS